MTFFISSFCFSQTKDAYDKKYEWRIRQKVLYGVYIPKDVNEALIILSKLTDDESKAKFKALSEDDAVRKLFFSLGRWITYNWSFYNGSRLSVCLGEMGIHSPEDKCRFMMILFHRSLNKKPLEIKKTLEQIHEKEKRAKEDRLKQGTIIYEETRQLERPANDKNGGQ